MSFLAKAERMANDAALCSVSSVNAEGFPRVFFLMKLQSDGLKSFYFACKANSKKVADYAANPRAGVSFFSGQDCVMLVGKMETLTDLDSKRKYWQDWMNMMYPKGADDPALAILKFTAEEGDLHFNHTYETVTL